ncbi:glycoside hydrolase family 88 protein [Hymenobacter sp. H14-R3]|uniref:DUF4350 domain-containing protein n=1 Tax=Hymenobacter sp. H14-R3 TaxID=3046308 RepID=UPI0024BB86B9|nr:DUF4350 domain-containing protein [Hymenobacter sp. H14-R3]MDJ0364230.1 glycoside hydrolase family 88 protein [Hymenobacter sp. H14-R3]
MPSPTRLLLTAALALPLLAPAQNAPAAMLQRMADAFIAQHPDSIVLANRKTAYWDHEQGLMLKALERVWERTGDGRYFTYIQKNLDQFVQQDGSIRTYQATDYTLANLATGPALLLLSQLSVPGSGKYRLAAATLRKQLAGQPRTKEGGFWHKKVYANQMWLDDLYMAAPFYAQYSALTGDAAGLDDVAKQFALVEKHLLDPKTGLLRHGYDESRTQPWANKATGQLPNAWNRAVGWYAMALVDVLDYVPATNPHRAELVQDLRRLAPVLARYQDAKTGTWSLVMGHETEKGNYAEASGSSMFVYALAKGVRLDYLDKKYAAVARKGYDGILKTFISTENGALALNGTVGPGGLGGTPYRDGSFKYYLSEPLRQNDLQGVGPFILASTEMEIAQENAPGQGKTVGLDYYFNHEMRKNAFTGQPEQWHYTWEDRSNGGFWLWGTQLRELGARTVPVPAAPTAATLKGLRVYVIVDPDSKKESPTPNYVSPADGQAVADWVRAGGTLVLLANDTANCEITHFNTLAQRFGMQFTNQSVNMVQGSQFEQGRVDLASGAAVFKQAKAAYVKELSVLALQSPAQPLVTNGGKVIMATAQVGKGRVFVLGDPWLYNEYTDGRKIPATFENFQAGKDLGRWLLK